MERLRSGIYYVPEYYNDYNEVETFEHGVLHMQEAR